MRGRTPGQPADLARQSRRLRYIATLKAHKAARLLKQHHSMAEAAELSGYSSAKYMRECIRRYITKREEIQQ